MTNITNRNNNYTEILQANINSIKDKEKISAHKLVNGISISQKENTVFATKEKNIFRRFLSTIKHLFIRINREERAGNKLQFIANKLCTDGELTEDFVNLFRKFVHNSKYDPAFPQETLQEFQRIEREIYSQNEFDDSLISELTTFELVELLENEPARSFGITKSSSRDDFLRIVYKKNDQGEITEKGISKDGNQYILNSAEEEQRFDSLAELLESIPLKVQNQVLLSPEVLQKRREQLFKKLVREITNRANSGRINKKIRKLLEVSYEILGPRTLDLGYMMNTLQTLIDENKLQRSKGKKLQKKLMKIFIKNVIGHEWGVDSQYSVSSSKIKTTGNLGLNVRARLAEVAYEYFQEKEPSSLSEESRKIILDTLDESIKFSEFYSSEHTKMHALEHFKEKGLLSLESGWEGHSVNITLHKAKDGNTYLYYTNRGSQAFEKTGGSMFKENDYNTKIFKVNNQDKINIDFLKQITSCNYHSTIFFKKQMQKYLEGDGESSMKTILDLEEIEYQEDDNANFGIPKTGQKVGNCTWANAKGGLHALLIAKHYDETYREGNVLLSNRSVSNVYRNAVQKGTEEFKVMEIQGRRVSLNRLLNYNPPKKSRILRPADHFSMISTIGKKVATSSKYQQHKSDALMREVNRMKTGIYNFIKNCRYPLDNCAIKGLPRNAVENMLKDVDDGSFMIIMENSEYFICYKSDNSVITTSLGNDGEVPLNIVLKNHELIEKAQYPILNCGINEISKGQELLKRYKLKVLKAGNEPEFGPPNNTINLSTRTISTKLTNEKARSLFGMFPNSAILTKYEDQIILLYENQALLLDSSITTLTDWLNELKNNLPEGARVDYVIIPEDLTPSE